MKEIKAGGNTAIENSSVQVAIEHKFTSNFASEVDTSIFLLKSDGKVRSDEDFIFYNQPESTDGSVKLTAPGQYSIDFNKVPAEIDKLAVTMVIDGSNSFSDATSVKLVVDGVGYFEPVTSGKTEKALILGQFYRHNGKWKFKAVGSGFNGGLAPLATAYGVSVADEEGPEEVAAPVDVEQSLTVKLQKEAPKLVSLAKPIAINLKKHKIENVKARVAFILDASGSMTNQFRKGNVQKVLERIVPLSLQFDDDGEMEFWAFSCRKEKFESVTSANFEGYIDRLMNPDFVARKSGWLSSPNIISGLGYSNNEKLVMRDVIDFVGQEGGHIPTFIIFITDGGITDSHSIESLIRESASLPIFWQFVGLGGSSYGILEHLDDMQGRVIDNCDFFNIDDLSKFTDDHLYSLLLNEFPGWLRQAKAQGIVL
ncbi:vWA domain-containing protein [Vibrio harveyi]|uniref:vWA domain-containing protein n=1 Tax=Vibrio harveyi TaxID=669 RepID=UPI003CEBA04C